MLNAPSSISSGSSRLQLVANATPSSSRLKPSPPITIRRLVTRPRDAISSADTTDPTAIDEVSSPKLAGSAFSPYSPTRGRIGLQHVLGDQRQDRLEVVAKAADRSHQHHDHQHVRRGVRVAEPLPNL